MAVLLSNNLLTGTGVVYQGNTSQVGSLTLFVDDNGGGSTLTFESSTDNSSWGNLSTGVYKFTNGVLTSNGGATATGKGVYWIDLAAVAFLRIRVSTYVSGSVATRFEESAVSVRSLLMSLALGLVGQGTSSQAAALPLIAKYNQFATAAANSGAILPAGLSRGDEIFIRNNGANALLVYPPVGGALNGGTINAAVSLAAGASIRYVSLGDGVGGYYSW